MKKASYFLALLIVIAISAIGGWLTSNGMDWYATINLPSWTPAGSIIGLVWTGIFILATLSIWFFLSAANRNTRFYQIVGLYLFNGFLNILWSYLFFNQHLINLATWEAGLLGLSVVILIISIWPISKPSASLLIPYAAWVTFATYLTYSVAALN